LLDRARDGLGRLEDHRPARGLVVRFDRLTAEHLIELGVTQGHDAPGPRRRRQGPEHRQSDRYGSDRGLPGHVLVLPSARSRDECGRDEGGGCRCLVAAGLEIRGR
jgi:hypothetical protein